MVELHRFISVPDVFTPAECDRIIAEAQSRHADKGRVLHKKRGSSLSMVRRCDVVWMKPENETYWMYNRLWELQHKHNPAIWNFQIDQIGSLQYLHYGALGWYARHFDNGSPQVATRKLTMSVQLSHPSSFKGGKLRIWGQQSGRYASQAQGSVTIFPSHLLHQANPVLWGHRHALIAWCEGNNPLR